MIAFFQDPIGAEVVRERAKEIIAGLSPASASKNWLQRLLEHFDPFRHVGSWMFDYGSWVAYTLYFLAAAAVIGLVILLVRQIEWRRARSPGLADAGQAAQVRERVANLLRRAREARNAGERLAALRLFFAAFVIGLSRRGDLEFREAWTNHELAQRGAHTPELRATLTPLVLELDLLVYGGREISDAQLNRLEELVEGLET